MQTLSKSFGLDPIRCVQPPQFPSLVPHPLSTQTQHSDRSTTAHPRSLEYQGTVQYLHPHSPSSTTRYISRIAEHYARKHRNTQGIAGQTPLQLARFKGAGTRTRHRGSRRELHPDPLTRTWRLCARQHPCVAGVSETCGRRRDSGAISGK
jgi:hypothetical protein